MEEKDKQLADEISKQVVDGIKKDLKGPIFGKGKGVLSLGLIKDIIIIAIVLFIGFSINNFGNKLKSVTTLDKLGDHDLTLENNGFLGFTAADFQEAIVGKATQKALFIVDEQELSVESTITQAGLFGWGALEKNQAVIYAGTAQYTVDLSKLSSKDIKVDDESHTITVEVPAVELHEVAFNPDKTIIGDSSNGLLAFGKVKLDMEQQQAVETEAKAKLEAKAKEEVCFNKAREYAKYSLRDFFETTIESVTNSYKVKVNFN